MRSIDSTRFAMPDGAIKRLFARIPRQVVLTFCSAVAIGLFVHLYGFTNLLLNHDNLNYLIEFNYGTASGRWFLPLVSRIGGDLSMPWLLGPLSVLLLAAAACLIGACLGVRRTLPCVLLGGLTVAFPSVTAGFLYMFTSAGYALGVLLACGCAYLALRGKKLWFLLAIVPLTLALGVYQTYFSFAAGLMVCALLLSLLDGETRAKPVIRSGLRCLIVLAASLACYLLLVKLTTANIEVTDYQGLSGMGSLSLSWLPRAVLQSYTTAAGFFVSDQSHNFSALVRAFWALAFLFGGLLFLLTYLRQRKARTFPARLLTWALLALVPLSCNLICVMAGSETLHETLHELMRYPLVLLPILMLAFYERAADAPEAQKKASRALTVAASWALSVSLFVCLWGCHVTANTAYGYQTLALKQTESYYTRLVSAIEQTEGYAPGLPVVLAGTPHALTRSEVEKTQDLHLVGVFTADMLIQSYSYRSFLSNITGFTPDWLDESDPARAEALRPEAETLPAYPAPGFATVRGGVLLINLGE